jgi:CDGSH-type Zn-finger protein
MEARKRIRVTADGPYIVEGGIPLAHETVVLGIDGEPESWEKGEKVPTPETYALCRCGKTGRAPFCDGAHNRMAFEGEETAPFVTLRKAEDITEGPEMALVDVPCRCSIARYCHRGGDAWTLTEQSEDPVKKNIAIESAWNCPSGRLSIRDKTTGRDIEPILETEIGVIHDTYHEGEGPLWVKGGIPVENSKGIVYESRNRVTLCRCGESKNKPFCDGAHVKSRFGRGQAGEK